MEDNTKDTQTSSELSQIKSDLANLYSHVSTAIGNKTEDAKVKWNETRIDLEAKRAVLEERAAKLVKDGSAASEDIKSGISAALSELKKAIEDAKGKFGN